MPLKGFQATTKGTSHSDNKIGLQDAAACYVDADAGVGMIAVADGHGGAKYVRSAAGAAIAVKVALQALQDSWREIKEIAAAKQNGEIKDFLKQLESNIIFTWRQKVREHLQVNALQGTDRAICKDCGIFKDENQTITVYGATLLFGLMTDDFWLAAQIGDGLCVALPEKDAPRPAVPEDKSLGFGRTTSLCDANAVEHFREDFGFESIFGMTAATDGVTDSFIPEKYLEFNSLLRDQCLEHPDTVEAELQNFLPSLSKRGSRDDCAIAGVWRLDGRADGQ